ncbi:MAG: glycosyltransferase family 39 protein [Anaerolineales bacterium]|nr:glycosyltransferase family 39 protein [Anaerolineales bacterium]
MKSWRSILVPNHAAMLERVALWAILLLAFALRVYRLDAQAIWWDESLSVYRATRDLGVVLANTILIQNVVTTDTLPQVYFLFLHLLVRAFGTSEFALRFFSVVTNVATIPLVYALARRWLGKSVALIAALLAALSPFYIWYAQEARPYALVLFWSTLAVYALTRAFKVSGSRFQVSRFTHHASRLTFWISIYILAAIAALFTHYFALFLFPFHAVLILILVWQTPRRRWFFFLPALPGASAIFLLPQVMASMTGNVGAGPYFVPLDVMLRDLLNSFSVGTTLDWTQAWWINAVMLALFALGIAIPNSKLRIANCELRIALLAYLFVPIFGVLVFSLVRPLYQNSRYLIAISPAFYLGVAAGLAALARWRRAFGALALGMFVVGAILSLSNWYFDPRFGKDDHRAWAESLRERARLGDLLILDSPHTEELYRYYSGDLVPIITLPILRADGKPSPDADRAAVRAAMQNNARVWFLAMHVPFDDPDARIEKYLNAEGVLLDQAKFAGTSTEIALSLFARVLPGANVSDIAHPLDIAFDGHLRLRGYDAPASGAPGTRVIVKLFWQVDAPVGEDYAISLRLIDPAGARVGQWDTIPLGNRSGSSTWDAQKIIVDTRDVIIAPSPPPGKYWWQVVPYHSATGNSLGDAVTLGEIQIH